MSYDREHDAKRDYQPTTDDSDTTAPGRASRSADLRRAETPLVSGILMRKSNGDAAADHEQAVAHASGSSGGALPDELRSKFEGSLGVDLSGVRVHTGSESAQAASAVGAHAYALGNDIHFGQGQYDPSSERGQHLIAHEVAHTVQQRGAPAVRQNKLAVSSPGDSAEVEADHAAAAMVAGRPASISSMPSTSGILHRTPTAPADGAATGTPSASGSAKISNKSAELSISGTYPITYKNQYISATASMTLTGNATLNYPSVTPDGVDGELSVGTDTKDGHKPAAETSVSTGKIKVYENDITGQAQRKGKSLAEELLEVSSVEVEPMGIKGSAEAAKGKDSTKKNSIGGSISTSVTINFAKRPPVIVTANLVGVKFEGGKPVISGPSASLALPIAEFPVEHDYGGGYTVKGTAKADLAGTVTPNWSETLAKKATEKVLEKIGQKAAETAVEGAEAAAPEAAVTAALDAAAIAEVAGFGAIAVSMGAAFVIGANQVEAIKDYAARGEQAVKGYVAGAMVALGAPMGGNGDPQFFVQGQGAYAGRLNQMMAAVKGKLPSDHNLSDKDIMARVMSEVRSDAADIAGRIESSVRPEIAKKFAEQYYKDQNSLVFKSEDRRDAQHIAERMEAYDVRVDEDGTAYQVDKDGKRIE